MQLPSCTLASPHHHQVAHPSQPHREGWVAFGSATSDWLHKINAAKAPPLRESPLAPSSRPEPKAQWGPLYLLPPFFFPSRANPWNPLLAVACSLSGPLSRFPAAMPPAPAHPLNSPKSRSLPNPLRVAAINFLNPAPLMWDFEHLPLAPTLASRYTLHYTQPSLCAQQLLSGEADLGLIPIAALTPALAIVPGCAIASLDHVRSILLLVKQPFTLETLRTVAADTASRSSIAYAHILLRSFHANDPVFLPQSADPIAMLQHADAALLIGDPALLARERQPEIEAHTGPLLWLDLAHEWHTRTGLPWVAAVWAAPPPGPPPPPPPPPEQAHAHTHVYT